VISLHLAENNPLLEEFKEKYTFFLSEWLRQKGLEKLR